MYQQHVSEELLDVLEKIGKSLPDIKCAIIAKADPMFCNFYDSDEQSLILLDIIENPNIIDFTNEYVPAFSTVASLKLNPTPEAIIEFLNNLDFTYNSRNCPQELYGMVWFKDGSWLERAEHDGSEWWSYKHVIPIPPELY